MNYKLFLEAQELREYQVMNKEGAEIREVGVRETLISQAARVLVIQQPHPLL